ncbi:MAG: hypothetical protein ACOYN0_13775 [Phycisphaerales bacterium]
MNKGLPNMIRISPRTFYVLAGLALPLASATMGGCDQRSPTSVAVESASREIQVVTGGGGARPEASDYSKTMTKVVTGAGAAAKEGTKVEQAAASLLVATANLGLASEAFDKTVAFDLTARNLATTIQSLASKWSTTSGTAAAAESFDPAAQIRELGALRESKDAEAARLRTELAAVQGRLNGLRSRAKTKLDDAAAKHARYTQLTSDAVRLTAAEAAKVVAEANVIRREGDALRLDGSKITAEADSIAPTIGEMQARIDELANQTKEFQKAQADLEARGTAFRKEASDARDQANTTANQLDAKVGELEKMYDGDLKEAFEALRSALSKANSASASSRDASPGFGKLSVGESQLSIADAAWAQAQSYGNVASVMEGLSRVAPKLPQASKYAEAAAKYRKVETDSLKEASEAFEAAATAFQGARVTGPSKERLEKLGTLIEKAKTVTSDRTADVTATFGLPSRSTPTIKSSGAAAATGDTDPALLTRLEEFLVAMKAGDTRADLIEGPAPVIKLVQASGNLDKKLREKLGSSFAEAMGPMGKGALDPKMFESLTVAQAKVEMTGADSAKVTWDGVPPMPFKKTGEGWKLDIMTLLGPEGQRAAIMAGPMTKVFDELAKDVEEGKIADTAALAAAMSQKMMNLMGPK